LSFEHDKLKEARKKLLAGEFGIVAQRVVPELRPEGPTFNSHARKGVVAIGLINLEARRAGTLCHAMSSIIALCRTFGAHSS
jgi:hypothetical protein